MCRKKLRESEIRKIKILEMPLNIFTLLSPLTGTKKYALYVVQDV